MTYDDDGSHSDVKTNVLSCSRHAGSDADDHYWPVWEEESRAMEIQKKILATMSFKLREKNQRSDGFNK